MFLRTYFLKRLLLLIPMVLGITFFSFAMMRVAGSDAVLQQADAAGLALSQEVLEARTRELLAWLSAITWQGLAIRPSCSVGGCAVRLPGPAYDQIYTQADNALYEAKRQGKGLCVLNQL